MNSELRYWLWLTIAFGPATPEKWNFMARYDSVTAAYNAVSRGDYRHVMPRVIKKIESIDMDDVDKLILRLEESGIKVCGYSDEEYPDRLRQIYNPPSVLFYKGDISCIDSSIVITCVGTKNPSEYSIEICSKICTDLSRAGVVIASGFQVGLDVLSHTSAIKAGGKTIAVLPCGIFYDYPKGSRKAIDAIAKNGLIITEYFPDDRPSQLTFRARNRVLSGVGLGTLVMQAGLTSGALSTAGYAIAQGRDIFCIPPHELFNDEYGGVINMIRDGAIPVFDAKDVLNEYFSTYSHKINLEAVTAPKSESGIFAATKTKTTRKKKPKSEAAEEHIESAEETSKAEVDTSTFTDDEKSVYEYISKNGTVSIYQLEAAFSELDDLVSVMTSLEIYGCIKTLPGDRYSI